MTIEHIAREPTDEMVTAFMREFEKWTPLLRYREGEKWHAVDIMGVRHALRAALLPLLTKEEEYRAGAEAMREAAVKAAEGRMTEDPKWLDCPIGGPYQVDSICARHRREVARAIRALPAPPIKESGNV